MLEDGVPIQLERRFSAVARTCDLGKVRADVGRVDARSLRGEQRIEPLAYSLVIVRRQQAARDAGLIRHDDDWNVRIVQPADRRGGARKELHIGRIAYVGRISDDRAVAIEERGGTVGHCSAARTARATSASSEGSTVRRS